VRRAALLAVPVLAVVAAGCGGNKDRANVSAAAQSYVAAFTAHDAGATCRAMTQASQEQVAEFAREHMHLKGATCARAVALLPPARSEAKVATVSVHGSTATVSVDGFDRPLTLVRESGSWRVRSSPSGETD
jgi:hypothetical protein